MNDSQLTRVDREMMRHGKGTLITQAGGYQVGYWMFDRLNGEGMEIEPDGTVYIGQWHKGAQEG